MFCFEWCNLVITTTESTMPVAVPWIYYTPEDLKILNRGKANGGLSNENREQNAD